MASREICAYLASLSSKAELEIYASAVASRLGVGKENLLEDTERYRRINQKGQRKKFDEKAMTEIEGFGDKVNKDKVRYSAAATIEEKILGILLVRPDLGKAALKKLNASSFVTDFNKKVFEFFMEDFEEGRQVNLSREGYFTAEEISSIVKMMALRESFDDNSQNVLDEYIEKLERQKEMREGEEKIKENPAEGLASYIEQLRKRKK
jgi:hypothetical protein